MVIRRNYLNDFNVDVPNAAPLAAAVAQIPEQIRERQQRNLLREASSVAAEQGLEPGSNMLLRAGLLDEGLSMRRLAGQERREKIDLRNLDRESQQKAFDWGVRLFTAAGGDPAIEQRAISKMAEMFGDLDDDDIELFRSQSALARREKDLSGYSTQTVEVGGESGGKQKVLLTTDRAGNIVRQSPLGDEIITPGKPPAGYRFTHGGGLEAIPGGPATKIPGEVAGRMALLQTSRKDMAGARKVMLSNWGATGTSMAQAGAGKIGRAQRTVRAGIEAALRAMTGAAAPDSEVDRYEDLFMPKSYDTKATAKQKLDMLEEFMREAESIISRGRGTVAVPSLPDPLDEARDAIRRGASRDAVIKRLRQMGIDPTRL